MARHGLSHKVDFSPMQNFHLKLNRPLTRKFNKTQKSEFRWSKPSFKNDFEYFLYQFVKTMRNVKIQIFPLKSMIRPKEKLLNVAVFLKFYVPHHQLEIFFCRSKNAEMQTTWPLGTSHTPDKDLAIFTDESLACRILHLHATVSDRLCLQILHSIRQSHLRLKNTTRNTSFNFLINFWLISDFSFLRIYVM